jgi:hypothetical protein
MQKKDFIQRAAIQFLALVEWDVNQAITYGERLWHRLTERGYGAPEATGPREAQAWYPKLQGQSKQQFEAFWSAFRHKHGRDGAAMRWYQLGDLSEEQAREIIDAAAAEARRQLQPGEVRKMAQGWLQERRWEDYQPVKAATPRPRDPAVAIRAELAALERLYNGAPNETLKTKIDQLRSRLA